MTGKWGWVVSIVPLAALLALTTNMSMMMLDAGRTIMATAQSGFLPKKLGEVHPEKHTPIAALSVVAVICVILSLEPDFINIIHQRRIYLFRHHGSHHFRNSDDSAEETENR